MNDLCKEWLQVLESGEYKKAKGFVNGIRDASKEGACIFGVAVLHFGFNWEYLRYEGIADKFGMSYNDITFALELNDKSEKTLPEIARELRSRLV